LNGIQSSKSFPSTLLFEAFCWLFEASSRLRVLD
jgi:hypothetical protein